MTESEDEIVLEPVPVDDEKLIWTTVGAKIKVEKAEILTEMAERFGITVSHLISRLIDQATVFYSEGQQSCYNVFEVEGVVLDATNLDVAERLKVAFSGYPNEYLYKEG